MRIGVDLDDTLSEMKDLFDVQICEYATKLGKKPDFKLLKRLHKDPTAKNIYSTCCDLTEKEMKHFFFLYHENFSVNNPMRPHCDKILTKLKEEGHEIIVITAREKTSHPDLFNITKKWLDKNNIPYDKLVLEGGCKSCLAKEENVDIFIDDNLNNCLEVEKKGIPTIKFCKGKEKNFTTNWKKVYKIIKKLQK